MTSTNYSGKRIFWLVKLFKSDKVSLKGKQNMLHLVLYNKTIKWTTNNRTFFFKKLCREFIPFPHSILSIPLKKRTLISSISELKFDSYSMTTTFWFSMKLTCLKSQSPCGKSKWKVYLVGGHTVVRNSGLQKSYYCILFCSYAKAKAKPPK